MSATPFSQVNQSFSDGGHIAAETQIYPYVFSVEPNRLTFRNTGLSTSEDGRILDGQMGVDYCVGVKSRLFQNPIEHSVQERFRNVSYLHKQDLTITEWNCRTSQPSELYKIKSGLFVYGYFDNISGLIVEWIAVNTTQMLMAIQSEQLPYSSAYNPRSEQDIIAIDFSDLLKNRCVIAYKKAGKHPVNLLGST